MGTVHFVTRKAALSECVGCHKALLSGVDEGMPYRLDPLPLTIVGEIAALSVGKRTFGFYYGGAHYRDSWRMSRKPRPCVFASHRCKFPVSPGHIEVEQVRTATDILRRYIEANAMAKLRAEEGQDVEQQCLTTLSELMGGKVIDIVDEDPAPF